MAKFTKVERVPCWAANYFANGELSGYSDEDLGLMRGYEDKWVAEVLLPDRVVFRKYWNRYDLRWTPIAFLPDVEAKPGWIMSYEHCGQHCEAHMHYYRSTEPCEPDLYAPLLKELESIGYRPRIMKRITRRKP